MISVDTLNVTGEEATGMDSVRDYWKSVAAMARSWRWPPICWVHWKWMISKRVSKDFSRSVLPKLTQRWASPQVWRPWVKFPALLLISLPAGVYDQIRQSIAYSHKNVKNMCIPCRPTLGGDGATHQILEDIGLMRMLPGMHVIVPMWLHQTKQAAIAISDIDGPVICDSADLPGQSYHGYSICIWQSTEYSMKVPMSPSSPQVTRHGMQSRQ